MYIGIFYMLSTLLTPAVAFLSMLNHGVRKEKLQKHYIHQYQD